MKNKKDDLDIVVDKVFCAYTFERGLALYKQKCRKRITDEKLRLAIEYCLLNMDESYPDSYSSNRGDYGARLRELVDYFLGRNGNIKNILDFESYSYPI